MNHDRELTLGNLEAFDMQDGRICVSLDDDVRNLHQMLNREQAKALADWLLLRLGAEE